jgi:hypothetical protein
MIFGLVILFVFAFLFLPLKDFIMLAAIAICIYVATQSIKEDLRRGPVYDFSRPDSIMLDGKRIH